MKKTELKKLIEDTHEAFNFMRSMEDLETMLQKQNPPLFKQFEKESGELWRELDAQNWADAFTADAIACDTHKQKLLSLIEQKSIKLELRRIIEEVLHEEKNNELEKLINRAKKSQEVWLKSVRKKFGYHG